MIIGVPKETKPDEYRISMLPVGVELLKKDGHQVLVQRNAGHNSGYEDEQYIAAGAEMIDEAADVWARADMIVKVKEPIGNELLMMKRGQTVFTYFHFAASRELTEGCLSAGVAAVAYETLTDKQGRLPLLTPMSEVAGRMSVQEGAKYLEKPMEGRGILLSGVPGVEPGNVLVLGGGVVGTQAAKLAAGMGAHVVIVDVNLDRLRYLDDVMPANVTTAYSDPHTIHREPIYIVDEIVHYCVANMPGAVGRTSTQALCHATQPYVLRLAKQGIDKLVAEDNAFATALNCQDGKLTNQAVAEAHDMVEMLV